MFDGDEGPLFQERAPEDHINLGSDGNPFDNASSASSRINRPQRSISPNAVQSPVGGAPAPNGLAPPELQPASRNDPYWQNLNLNVNNPHIRKVNFATKFYLYNISLTPALRLGDSNSVSAGNGTSSVERRFSDFDALRQYLMDLYPGCYVPSLPPKKMLGNYDDDFIQGRMADLERFLVKITERPHLRESIGFIKFISDTDYKGDDPAELQRAFNDDVKRASDDFQNSYRTRFGPIIDEFRRLSSGFDVNVMDRVINEAKEMLKTAAGQADTLCKSATAWSVAVKEASDQIDVMRTNVQTLRDTENTYARVQASSGYRVMPVRDNKFCDPLGALHEAMDGAQIQIFARLVLTFQRNLEDINALQEAIKCREDIKDALVASRNALVKFETKYLVGARRINPDGPEGYDRYDTSALADKDRMKYNDLFTTTQKLQMKNEFMTAVLMVYELPQMFYEQTRIFNDQSRSFVAEQGGSLNKAVNSLAAFLRS